MFDTCKEDWHPDILDRNYFHLHLCTTFFLFSVQYIIKHSLPKSHEFSLWVSAWVKGYIGWAQLASGGGQASLTRPLALRTSELVSHA